MDKSFPSLNHQSPILKKLSEKEYRCIVNYFLRKPYKQIARELNLSPKTVETYLRRVSEKIDLPREELFLVLWESGVFQELVKKDEDNDNV
jgi:DNA-binding CsgD family transcriptional regulator